MQTLFIGYRCVEAEVGSHSQAVHADAIQEGVGLLVEALESLDVVVGALSQERGAVLAEGSVGELAVGAVQADEEAGVEAGQVGGIARFILEVPVLALGRDGVAQDAGDVDPHRSTGDPGCVC